MPHWWGTPTHEKLGIGDADRGIEPYPCLYTRYSSRQAFFRGGDQRHPQSPQTRGDALSLLRNRRPERKRIKANTSHCENLCGVSSGSKGPCLLRHEIDRTHVCNPYALTQTRNFRAIRSLDRFMTNHDALRASTVRQSHDPDVRFI